jgi:hypothetical protein
MSFVKKYRRLWRNETSFLGQFLLWRPGFGVLLAVQYFNTSR